MGSFLANGRQATSRKVLAAVVSDIRAIRDLGRPGDPGPSATSGAVAADPDRAEGALAYSTRTARTIERRLAMRAG